MTLSDYTGRSHADEGSSQVNAGTFQSDGGLSQADTEPFRGNVGSSQPITDFLGEKKDPLRMTEDHRARAAQIDR